MARLGCSKSGGCRTCKKRKVKCDENHPTCARCRQANRKCEGYMPEHRFVDENARIERRTRRKSVRHPFSSQYESRQACVAPVKYEPSLNLGLGLQAFEYNIFVSFLLSNLFLGIPPTAPWPHLHADDNTSSSGSLSIQALSTMFFGQVHRQKQITLRGQALYGQALVGLNQNLQNSQNGLSLSVLESAMILEFYELIAFNSASGWLKHAGGVGQLIELRGPYMHQSPGARSVLEASRLIVILECLVRRKPCFLSSTSWKTIPWALEPQCKPSVAYLYDILSDIPGLMQCIDSLQASNRTVQEVSARQRFVSKKVTTLWANLYQWRLDWQLRTPASTWLVPAVMNGSPFQQVFQFSSLSNANEITLYNASLLLILRAGYQVIGPSFKSISASSHFQSHQNIDYSPHIHPNEITEAVAVANEICKSVEYHLQEERQRGGAFLLLFPLRLAWQVFEPESATSIWIQRIMNTIAESTSIEISRGLTEEMSAV